VGSGWVAANRHIISYLKDPRVNVVAIIDRKQEQARRVSKRFGILKVFPKITDVDLDIDLVSICTPPQTHHEIAMECLNRGWNVLVEKPMAMTLTEADQMIKAAEKSHAKLSVVHNFLFSHSMRKTKALIASGQLGDVQAIEILQTSNLHRHLPDWYGELPGGLFFDEGPHAIYMSQFFLANFDLVDARAQVWDSHVQPVRNVEVSFESSKATGHLNMLFTAGRDEWFCTVIGTRSMITLDLFRDKLLVLGPGARHTPGEVLLSSISSMLQEARGVAVSSARWATGRLLFGHDKQISLFVESILTNSNPPVTAEEGRGVVACLSEIVRRADL
jgi:predicted dehydrogenase